MLNCRTKALGGGVVLELGIYCIQFILLAMGGDGPEKIEAQGILNDEVSGREKLNFKS